jgi:hypothetical protein
MTEWLNIIAYVLMGIAGVIYIGLFFFVSKGLSKILMEIEEEIDNHKQKKSKT